MVRRRVAPSRTMRPQHDHGRRKTICDCPAVHRGPIRSDCGAGPMPTPAASIRERPDQRAKTETLRFRRRSPVAAIRSHLSRRMPLDGAKWADAHTDRVRAGYVRRCYPGCHRNAVGPRAGDPRRDRRSRAGRPARHRLHRAWRTSSGRFRDLLARGGAGRDRIADATDPAGYGRYSAEFGRSDPRLSAFRDAGCGLERTRRGHSRSRFVHGIVSAVRLRPAPIQRAVRGEARSVRRAVGAAAGELAGQAAPAAQQSTAYFRRSSMAG